MPQTRLFVTTAVLTIFLWVSADQLLTESVEIRCTTRVQTEPGSGMVVRLDDPGEVFRVTVAGRQNDVRKLRDRGSFPILLTLRDDDVGGGTVGPFAFPLLDKLRRDPAHFPNCLVRSVDPESLRVTLDRKVTVPVPIAIRPGKLDYSVEPNLEPRFAQVTLLESDYRRVAGNNPRLAIDVEGLCQNQPVDTPLKLDVGLRRDLESDAGTVVALDISPQTASLTATLRQQRKSGTIQAVPVKLQLNLRILRQFDVEFRDPNPPETLSVRVVGPPELVDKLVAGEIRIVASISPGSDASVAGSFQFFAPEFNLPTGVELDKGFDERFEIRLVPRPALHKGERRDVVRPPPEDP